MLTWICVALINTLSPRSTCPSFPGRRERREEVDLNITIPNYYWNLMFLDDVGVFSPLRKQLDIVLTITNLHPFKWPSVHHNTQPSSRISFKLYPPLRSQCMYRFFKLHKNFKLKKCLKELNILTSLPQDTHREKNAQIPNKMDWDFKLTPTYNPQWLLKCRQFVYFDKGLKSLTKNQIPLVVSKIYTFQFHQITHPTFGGKLEMSASLKPLIGKV